MQLNRRTFMAGTAAAVTIGSSSTAPAETNASPAMSRITAFAFAFKALDDGDIRLADYADRPIMVVNTASLCGYTPQYAALQQLWTEFQPAGLMIIAVPSNDFGGPEPGEATDIDKTARQHYGVSFPITAKTVVRGADAHPFYKWAAQQRPNDLPAWNFHKYLVGRHGYIADVFASAVDPTDTRVKTAIGRALAES